jgi:hypothetical protein
MSKVAQCQKYSGFGHDARLKFFATTSVAETTTEVVTEPRRSSVLYN